VAFERNSYFHYSDKLEHGNRERYKLSDNELRSALRAALVNRWPAA